MAGRVLRLLRLLRRLGRKPTRIGAYDAGDWHGKIGSVAPSCLARGLRGSSRLWESASLVAGASRDVRLFLLFHALFFSHLLAFNSLSYDRFMLFASYTCLVPSSPLTLAVSSHPSCVGSHPICLAFSSSPSLHPHNFQRTVCGFATAQPTATRQGR